MKLTGIYKITSPSGKIYIGQSIDIKRRFNYYKNLKNKQQPKLYNSFLKYGVDSHKFEIIELCMQKYLNNVERYYQQKYDTVNNGLNLMYVKNEHFNGNHSKESREKISKGLKGKPIHENTKKAIINYNKTRILSPETIEKMRNAQIGKKHSKETIEKQRQKRLGTKRSEATKQKQRDNSPKKKAIIQYDLDMNYIAEYNSLSQAIRVLNKKCTTGITHCLSGKYKSSYGFIWRYKTD